MKDEYKYLLFNKLRLQNKSISNLKPLGAVWHYCTYIVPAKLDWTQAAGFAKLPPLFQVSFLVTICHVRNHPPFYLEVSACFIWRTCGCGGLPGIVGLCELEPPRRRLAG